MEATATRDTGLAATVRSASRAWDLLLAVTVRDMKARYQGTLLSYLWWIARPLALGFVLYFALGKVLQLRQENYSVFLLAGLFPWFWFSGGVLQSASAFTINSGLLKKVRFPRLVLPLSAVFYNAVQFLLTLPVLAIFAFFTGVRPDVTWVVGIPIMFALQLLLVSGLGTLFASLGVFLRDLEPLLDVAFLLLFYMSPILYPLDRVPGELQPILKLSPITTLLEGWRGVFLEGSIPGIEIWPAVVGTAVALALGLTTFRSLEKYFADAL